MATVSDTSESAAQSQSSLSVLARDPLTTPSTNGSDGGPPVTPGETASPSDDPREDLEDAQAAAVVHEDVEGDQTTFRISLTRDDSIGAEYELDWGQLRGVGRGTQVIVAIHRLTRQSYAVKVVEKSKLDAKQLEQARREIDILRCVQHPNIVTLHRCFEDDVHVYLVLDLMESDLFSFMFANPAAPHRLSELEVASIMRQVFCAVAYLHQPERSIVHRDIKLENVLITALPVPNTDADSATELGSSFKIEVKLADFGLAKCFGNAAAGMSTPAGTAGYIAPEILQLWQERGYEPALMSTAGAKMADMWCLGVTLYIMLTCTVPAVEQIQAGTLFPAVGAASSPSRSAQELVTGLLQYTPGYRLSIEEAQLNPFVAAATSRTSVWVTTDSLRSESSLPDDDEIDERSRQFIQEQRQLMRDEMTRANFAPEAAAATPQPPPASPVAAQPPARPRLAIRDPRLSLK